MKFFTTLFGLSTLVCLTICQRRDLVFFSEEELDKVEEDRQGRGDADRAADFEKKGREIRDAVTTQVVKFPKTADKPVSQEGKLWMATERPVDVGDGKSRIIFPTEDGETAGRGWKGRTKDIKKPKIKVPENLLIAMNNVQTADEFLRRFVERIPDDEIFNITRLEFPGAARPAITGRRGTPRGRLGLQVAPFARCQPQKTVVKVENSEGIGVLMWPSCVYVHRCGGCCTSELMTCRPTATSTVNVTVLQTRYTGSQSYPFTSEGVVTVSMEQHDRCSCGCKELPEDCTELQEYRKNECRCVCANQDEATRCQQGANKFWDSRDCACKCRTTRECSSSLFFNIETCSCEVQRFFLSARTGISPLSKNKTGILDNGNSTKSEENG